MVIFWTIFACSATPFSVPWNSIQSTGATGSSSFEYRMIESMAAASASSMRATAIPAWMIWITVLTATSTLGNEHVAADIAAGMP